MRLQAKNTTQRGQSPCRIIIQGRIICVKCDSEVHFIKECIPSVIYLSERWLQKALLSTNVIQPLYIYTRKPSLRPQMLGHQSVIVSSKQSATSSSSSRTASTRSGGGGDDSSHETKVRSFQGKPCATVGSVAVDTEGLVSGRALALAHQC
jgi:hypothetical protein